MSRADSLLDAACEWLADHPKTLCAIIIGGCSARLETM